MLSIVIHNHQPVGNFEWVIDENINMAYRPFIKTLMDFPDIKCHFHFSGALWDYILEKHRDILEDLKILYARNQIRMLGGGYYEPILPMLPIRDRLGQLTLMNDRLFKDFDIHPVGAWIAERVFSDEIIPQLKACGIKYILLDENHLKDAGIEIKKSCYLTEKDGDYLNIFLIDQFLRYEVPWGKIDKIIKYIKENKSDFPVILADDGEKFGAWPGSFSLVYERGWLKDFFSALLKNDIETVFLDDFVNKDTEIIYIPDSSYEAFNVWSLLPNKRFEYEYYKEMVTDENLKKNLKTGYYKLFLYKYPESLNMYQRFLYLSKKDLNEKAKIHLWKSQCNCAYWHGMFGGIYLKHLRNAIYKELILAQKCVNNFDYPYIELDALAPGRHFFSNGSINIVFDERGGAISNLDLLEEEINLVNIVSRHPEFYHIEAIEKMGIDRVFCDNYQRNLFIDHFFSDDLILNDLKKSEYGEQGDFIDKRYIFKSHNDNSFSMDSIGEVITDEGRYLVAIEKYFTIDNRKINLDIIIKNLTDRDFNSKFGEEINLSCIVNNDGDIFNNIDSFKFECNNFDIVLKISQKVDLWHFEINTLSKTHHNFEYIKQGDSYIIVLPISISPFDEKKISINMEVI